MVLTPVVFNASSLRLERFRGISIGVQGVDRLKNLPQLICCDGISVCTASALEDVFIVAESFLVGLDNYVCGSKD